MVRITFFNGPMNLGTYDCLEGSSQEDRNAVAAENGIVTYNKFVLDNGRVTGYVDNGRFTHCEYGEDGTNQLNTNTMEENRTAQNNYANPVGMPPIPGTGEPTPVRRFPRTLDEWAPEKNKARGIQISQQDHGYIVNVGCQTLVFEKMETLIEKLTAYLKDPSVVEKQWLTEGIL